MLTLCYEGVRDGGTVRKEDCVDTVLRRGEGWEYCDKGGLC